MFNRNLKFIFPIFIIIMILILFDFCTTQDMNNKTNEEDSDNSYMKSFLDFKTHLTKKIKAPQEFYGLPSKMENMDIIYYKSEGLKLKAFLWNKNINPKVRKPALIYFHGGFSVDYEELYKCKQFIDSGFIVFTPTYRGEIGNPGFFECFLGEIKDAKEAVRWLAKQSYIDTTRIYTFGHSIGGGISLMLSFHNDIPIKFGASSAGLYNTQIYESFDKSGFTIPFDFYNEKEVFIRTPITDLTKMRKKHYLYCGLEDEYTQAIKKLTLDNYKNIKLKLYFIDVEGDHITSLDNALDQFCKMITK